MTRSVTLDARQRQALLDRYRRDSDPDVRSRCHILLLLADGYTWEEVGSALYCSSRTIDRWVKRFHEEGLVAVAACPNRHHEDPIDYFALALALAFCAQMGFWRNPSAAEPSPGW